MKLHWGHGLIIFFICYISYLVYVVVKSTTVNRGMVMENYYDYDLDYQNKYDEVKNGLERSQQVTMSVDHNRKMRFAFGDHDGLRGQVKFYRPSDPRSDKQSDFSIEQGDDHFIDLSGLKAGRWKIQLQWVEGQESYYQEFDYFMDL